MCGQSGVQFRLSPRQFWNTGRDVDLQPNGYRFRGVAKATHPPLLAMWHCAACSFTAESGEFQDPLKGVLIRPETVAFALKERVRNDSGYRKVVESLHADVCLDAMDFYQAVKLHLLALRIWDEIGGMVKQDYLTQAKYSLLLAWLYRDLQVVDSARAQTAVRLERLFAELRPVWPDLPATETAALHRAIRHYENSLGISTFIKDPINEVTALHRIGRIQMKMGEYGPARESFRRSTILSRSTATEIRRQLAVRGRAPGREEVTGAAREALIDREQRLSLILADEERLTEAIREALAKAATPR